MVFWNENKENEKKEQKYEYNWKRNLIQLEYVDAFAPNIMHKCKHYIFTIEPGTDHNMKQLLLRFGRSETGNNWNWTRNICPLFDGSKKRKSRVH